MKELSNPLMNRVVVVSWVPV